MGYKLAHTHYEYVQIFAEKKLNEFAPKVQ